MRESLALLWFVLHFAFAPTALAQAGPLATPATVEFGRQVFFDVRFSDMGTIACSSCHQPSHLFSDGRPTSIGHSGRTGTRNAPSLIDVHQRPELFWDGRGSDLRAQVLEPLFNPVEHGLTDEASVLKVLTESSDLSKEFAATFDRAAETATLKDIGKAIAAYLTTLNSSDAAFDRSRAGNTSGMSPAATKGFRIFTGQANCGACHHIGEGRAQFTDNGYHSLGIGRTRLHERLQSTLERFHKTEPAKLGHAILSDPDFAELGRYVVTRKPADIGKFRTPSLRGVALTAPYMHDGSIATLEEAVEHELYYRALKDGRPILLRKEEKSDLVEFLKALTSDNLPQ